MKRVIKKDSTDQSVDVFIQDSSSTTGAGLTGLVFNSAGLSCYYRRGALGSATALTLATLATIGTAHADGGFKEIDATNMPGWYRLDLSDAIVATGVAYASIQLKGAANMAPCNVEIQLDPVPGDITHVGGTAVSATYNAWIEALAIASGSSSTSLKFSSSGFDVGANALTLYKGRPVYVATGSRKGSLTFITSMAESGGVFTATVSPALSGALADNDVIEILPASILAPPGSVALTESYAGVTAEGTIAQLLYFLQQLFRETTVSGTTMTTKKLDQSTTAFTHGINDTNNPTAVTRST